jgi:glycerophosphoryl diester phosphodiesterase
VNRPRAVLAGLLLGGATLTVLSHQGVLDRPANFHPGAAAPWLRCAPSMAHALGGLDSVIYTNSREAFEVNYARGFRFFETDVRQTSDGRLVLAHDWTTADRQRVPAEGPTLDEFRQSRIYGRYTPLTLTDLLALLQQHPDVRVTLDLKEQRSWKLRAQMLRDVVKTVQSVDPALLKRVIPQVWSSEDAAAATALYPWPLIYSIHESRESNDAIVADVRRLRIAAVVLNRFRLSPAFAQRLRDAGAVVYLSTANVIGEVKVYRAWGVDGFVTDALPPDSLCHSATTLTKVRAPGGGGDR